MFSSPHAQREPLAPVEQALASQRRWFWAALGGLLVVVAISVYWGLFAEVPVDYSNPEDHFLYGSIGSDTDSGIPYRLWAALPEMFPEHLPDPQSYHASPDSPVRAGYGQFGFLFEEGMDRPIGFSRRRAFVDRVGLNCAVCHVGTVQVPGKEQQRAIYGRAPRLVDGERVIVSGMPAHGMDLQGYARFLHRCAADARFTTENVLSFIEGDGKLGPIEHFAYQRAIPLVREALLRQKQALRWLGATDEKGKRLVPDWGPGRVDTFNPYKTQILGGAWDGTVGTSDLPSLWNQRPREGMQLHWDGNNTSVFERNISASLGAGATPTSLDLPRMLRVAAWAGSPPPYHQAEQEELDAARASPCPREGELEVPRYPFQVDEALAREGARIYKGEQVFGEGKEQYRVRCAACHDWKGEYVGKVEPLGRIRTDPERLLSYTAAFAGQQNSLGAGQPWRFSHFRRTDGYANQPLDGLWARAPYLHNGSVPTLGDLLRPAEQRPRKFYRGNDAYDKKEVGFVSKDARAGGRSLFLFDTSLRGNSNAGHAGKEYGTQLPEGAKRALLEYLKTL